MWVIINIIWVTFVICLIAFLLTYRYIWNGCDLWELIVLSSIVFATVSFLWLLWSTFFISDSQLIETSKVISTRQLSKVRKINLSKINFKKGKQAKLITKKYSYKINQKSVSWYQKYIFYGELDLLLEAHLNTHYQYTVELPK
jgi:hypothetical protein